MPNQNLQTWCISPMPHIDAFGARWLPRWCLYVHEVSKICHKGLFLMFSLDGKSRYIARWDQCLLLFGMCRYAEKHASSYAFDGITMWHAHESRTLYVCMYVCIYIYIYRNKFSKWLCVRVRDCSFNGWASAHTAPFLSLEQVPSWLCWIARGRFSMAGWVPVGCAIDHMGCVREAYA